MARIEPLQREQATGASKDMLDGIHSKFGMVPNLLGTLAHSPGVLGAYMAFNEAMSKSSLSAAVREQIALAVAGANGCDYCAAAHTAIAAGAGVPGEEAAQNLAGEATDPKVRAALSFARALVEKRGWASDNDVASARAAGLTDGEILEVIATVAINIFTNYSNHTIQTEIDFPKVEIPETAGV